MKPTNTSYVHRPQPQTTEIAALKAELRKQQAISNEMKAEIEKLKSIINQQLCNAEKKKTDERVAFLKNYAHDLLENLSDDFTELHEAGFFNTDIDLVSRTENSALNIYYDPDSGVATVKVIIEFDD